MLEWLGYWECISRGKKPGPLQSHALMATCPSAPSMFPKYPGLGVVGWLAVKWGCRAGSCESLGFFCASKKLALELRALPLYHFSQGCFSFVYTIQEKMLREACLEADRSVPTFAEDMGSCLLAGIPVFL